MHLPFIHSNGAVFVREWLLAVLTNFWTMNSHHIRFLNHLECISLMPFLSARFLAAFAAQTFGLFLFSAFISTGWPVRIAAVLIQ